MPLLLQFVCAFETRPTEIGDGVHLIVCVLCVYHSNMIDEQNAIIMKKKTTTTNEFKKKKNIIKIIFDWLNVYECLCDYAGTACERGQRKNTK